MTTTTRLHFTQYLFILLCLFSAVAIYFGYRLHYNAIAIQKTIENRTLPLLGFQENVLQMQHWLLVLMSGPDETFRERALRKTAHHEEAARDLLQDQIFDHAIGVDRHNRLVSLQRDLARTYRIGRRMVEAELADDHSKAHAIASEFGLEAETLIQETHTLIDDEKNRMHRDVQFLNAKTDLIILICSMGLVGFILIGVVTRRLHLDYIDTLEQETRDRRAAEDLARQEAGNLEITLNSIGDGVIVCDRNARVSRMNPVAEALTGWSMAEGAGRPMKEVFDIINAETREPAVSPVARVLETGTVMGLANHTILIAKDGTEYQIADSAAPILRDGIHADGVVLVFRDVTLEYAKTETLRKQEAEYQNLFSNMLTGFAIHEIICDDQGQPIDYRFLSINPAFEDITGLKAEEIIGRRIKQIMPETEEDWIQTYGRVALTGEPLRFEQDAKALGKHFQVQAFQPEPGKFACLFMDITRSRQAEEALRKSQEMLERTNRMARIGGWEMTIPDGKTRWTDEVYRIHGYDLGLMPETEELLSHYPPEARQKLVSSTERCSREKVPYDLELPFVQDSGDRIWVRVIGIPVVHDGQVTKIQGVIQDITDLKATTEKLHRFEEQYELAQRLSGLGTWDWNVQTGEILWSDGMYDALHVPPDSFDGTFESFTQLVLPEDRSKVAEAISRTHQTGEIFDIEYRIVGEDEQTYWIRALGNVLREPDGTVLSMLGIVEDITERTLDQQRLQQMQKMDAIGQLAGGVAHDFNNQLGGIMGFGDLLSARLSDPVLKGYVDKILVCAERSADLTRQLLDFSRRSDHEQRPIELHDLLLEVTSILEHSLDKRVSIQAHFEATDHVILGDPSSIQNALLNLGINARDAMPEGGTLSFSTSNIRLTAPEATAYAPAISPGRYIRIQVRDTGIGMDRETQARVFEPFFTTKDVGQGTGMGLASVYACVTRNHGTIEVTSAPGAGTVFTLLLPVKSPLCENNTSGDDAVFDLANLRVLVVDDEVILREMAVEMLSLLGCTATSVNDGAAAIAYLKDHAQNLDIMILDMVMPGLDGPAVFHTLQKIRPDLPVLIASGYSSKGKVQTLLDAGAAGFIQKPFHPHDLANSIRRCLT